MILKCVLDFLNLALQPGPFGFQRSNCTFMLFGLRFYSEHNKSGNGWGNV